MNYGLKKNGHLLMKWAHKNYFHEKQDDKKLKMVETKIFRLAWLPVLVLKTANQAQ